MIRALPLLVVALAACAGRERDPANPEQGPPRLQVVRCTPATPAPVLADDGVTFGGLTKAEVRSLERPSRNLPQLTISSASTAPASESIARVLRDKLDELRACYVREVWRTSRTGRKVVLGFSIRSDGRAFNVSASGASEAFGTCAAQALASARFPGTTMGGLVSVSYELDVATPTEPIVPEPWTPFALDGSPPLEGAPVMARAAESALRGQLDRLGACFHGFLPTGSIRAMLDLDDAGSLRAARVGGLGDHEVEACLRRALVGLVVPSPALQPAEIACDLARGDAQRWRVDPAGYELIRATRTGAIHGTTTLAPGAGEPEPLEGNKTYLVVLDPDAPGTVLDLALEWAFDGDATVLAAADPTGGAPQVIGVGRSTFALGDAHDPPGAQDVSLELYGDVLAACVAGTTDTVPIAEASKLAQRLAAACRKRTCAGTVTLAVEGGAPASAVPTAVDALRRAGFERVLIGSGLGCARTQPGPPRG